MSLLFEVFTGSVEVTVKMSFTASGNYFLNPVNANLVTIHHVTACPTSIFIASLHHSLNDLQQTVLYILLCYDELREDAKFVLQFYSTQTDPLSWK